MKVPLSNTFTFNRKKYSVIGMTGDPILSTDPYYDQRCFENYAFRGKWLCITKRIRRGRCAGFLPHNAKMLTNDEYLVAKNLREVIHFTGKIRLGRDFIEDLNVPTGYQKPTSFITVLDITLKGGRIVEIIDRSQEMQEGRVALKQRYDSGSAEQSTVHSLQGHGIVEAAIYISIHETLSLLGRHNGNCLVGLSCL